MTGFPTGSFVVLFLHTPKQKIWGQLQDLGAAGVVVRGLDLAVFDDWMRQEARGEAAQIGLTTTFYPLMRVERMEIDETIGCVAGYVDRFRDAVGREAEEVLRGNSDDVE
jgi:hypothetical protein